MKLAVIIPAAGTSRRFTESLQGQGIEVARSKLDEDLGGRPVLHRSIELFTNLPQTHIIIVAGPADATAMEAFRLRHGDKLGMLGCKLCAGGKDHRYETVQNALKLVPSECSHVAIHDAARPCTPGELIERVLQAAEDHPAVIPGVPVGDTLKRVGEPIKQQSADPLAAILGEGSDRRPALRRVEATVDRANLVGVQTPQVFARELLVRVYAQKNLDSTDDAQLVERLGEAVYVVPGDVRNIKITRAEDVPLARMILGLKGSEGRSSMLRF